MIFSQRADGLSLQAECEQDLQSQVRALLAALSDMHRRGPALGPGSLILYGWVQLRLESHDGGLRVCEPDFYADDIEHYVPRVDYTLRVIDEQARLIQRIGCSSKATLFTDSLVLAKASLAERRIYLERRAAVKENDSGWYIGPLDHPLAEGERLASIQAYRLLRLRPEVMPVLALPEGYIATFDGERLEAILDHRDVRVWSQEESQRS